jgi:hypothetical protein
MGSGQPITDPFLAHLCRVFFDGKQPNLQEGIFSAVWALEHAIELNPGGINGPSQLAILTRSACGGGLSARLLSDDEVSEHLSSVKGAEAHMRGYREILAGNAAKAPSTPAPDPPSSGSQFIQL